jgi:hypothetical protein
MEILYAGVHRTKELKPGAADLIFAIHPAASLKANVKSDTPPESNIY